MATILRVDTPDRLRDLDARLNDNKVRGRIVFSLIMSVAAPVVLVFAVLALDPIGVIVAILWLVLWVGWIIRLWHKLKAAREYRVPVRHGIAEIREAHNIYRRLSNESSSREYALPLVNTMYQISVIEVQSEYGERRLAYLMRERVHALRNLLRAEDRIAIASARGWTEDRDDLDAASAYQDALNEVEAKLRFEI